MVANPWHAVGLDPDKVDAHRRSEAATGWQTLRRCPSTSATATLTFLDSLTADEAVQFVLELAAFEDDGSPAETLVHWQARARAHPTLARFLVPEDRPPARGLGRVPVKVLAGVGRDSGVGGLEGWMAQSGLTGAAALPPPALAASLDELEPVPPRTLRRLVATMMQDRFGAEPVKLARDQDRFGGSVDGTLFEALLGWATSGGHSSHQMEYHVRRPGASGQWTGYEALWRTAGRWDYLTSANAARSIDHLGDVITTLVALR